MQAFTDGEKRKAGVKFITLTSTPVSHRCPDVAPQPFDITL